MEEKKGSFGTGQEAGAGIPPEGQSKKFLRSRILKARRALSAEEIRQRSLQICRRLQQTDQWQGATSLCVYMPIHQEAEADLLIPPALAAGKKVYIPRVCGQEMVFNAWDPEMICEQGPYHIRQSSSEEVLVPDEGTLIVMPGAVFDPDLHRIGYGGGYYDRYLARHPVCQTVAICFEMQIVDAVPAEAHDICPQMIVSEERILTGGGSTHREEDNE